MRVGDIAPPVPGSASATTWSLLIAPFEFEVLSKSRFFGEAIALGDTRASWLG